ncbi:HK97 gp10 family phage protein [Metabacillus idriensis]|uniref:HK97-gp10 family putative phage morphogenesis protein n=1 Tax=Metabacillus idriensis TaxID=324768 RepID=UPI00174BBDB9|nr:HK97-gp10 family putative phage morphogenesis protein [Metabacillus idriensis]MCM3599007.1 HK97 gp10 family phage protein [Metabacillus idriensis]
MPAELDGMAQLLQQLDSMGRRLETTTKEKALEKGGEFMKDKLKPAIPVRTGKWRDNIIVSDVKNDEVAVGADQQGNAFYGHMYEFGTSKQPARPVYGPVFENNKGRVQEIMADEIKRDLGL